MLPRYAAMIPTLVPNPFHRDGWIYEEKVDGYRMLAPIMTAARSVS